MAISFVKYHGTGNDFIIIDDRNGAFVDDDAQSIALLCDRHKGIGADGLMLLRESAEYDFKMIYYNSDGALGSMCGNGARCIVQWAKSLGVNDRNITHGQNHFSLIKPRLMQAIWRFKLSLFINDTQRFCQGCFSTSRGR